MRITVVSTNPGVQEMFEVYKGWGRPPRAVDFNCNVVQCFSERKRFAILRLEVARDEFDKRR